MRVQSHNPNVFSLRLPHSLTLAVLSSTVAAPSLSLLPVLVPSTAMCWFNGQGRDRKRPLASQLSDR
eukprot:3626032-Rhodomonas_salina.3